MAGSGNGGNFGGFARRYFTPVTRVGGTRGTLGGVRFVRQTFGQRRYGYKSNAARWRSYNGWLTNG